MGTLSVLDKTGDSKLIWDPENPDEVAAARAMFNNLRKKGHLGYTVRGDSKKGDQIHEFDPAASAIIMSPALVGG